MRLAGQTLILFLFLALLLALVGCQAPPTGKAHTAMGGASGCAVPSTDPSTVQRTFVAGATSPNDIQGPKGIIVDLRGNLVAPDNVRGALLVYNGTTGAFVRQVRDSGSLNFDNPEHLALGPDGKIYVSDAGNTRIIILNADYTFFRRFGSSGTGNGQFQFPEGVAVDANGDIYVADQDRDDIQRFSSAGAFISRPVTGLADPEFLFIDRTARELFVSVDTEVRRYSLTNFAFLGGIGRGRFAGEPEGIAVDKNGRVYVADEDAGKILIFSRPNTYLHSFRIGGTTVDRPDGIAYDAARNQFVLTNDRTDNEKIVALSASAVEAITWCPCVDADNDTFYPDAGCAPSGDCDDGNAAVKPGAAEACNNVDDDCDALIDEGIAPRQCGTTDVGPCQFGTQACSAGVWGNCAGAIEPAPEVCGNGLDEDCSGADLPCPQQCVTDADGDGYKAEAGCPSRDCDDADNTTHPGAVERCGNARDDDCDSQVDEAGCCTPAPETCDGADNDCNGVIDNGCPGACATDADGDGYKSDAACAPALKDCDDSNRAVHPGAPENCSSLVDDDCDGTINEDCGPCAAPDCLWCDGAGCPGCGGANCTTCWGAGCPSCEGHDCTTCLGADCPICEGPDCATCTGPDCPNCGGPDCTTCTGADCPNCTTSSCAVCQGADCPPCLPFWSCTEWSVCQSDLESRTCTDGNACNMTQGRPLESRSCGQGDGGGGGGGGGRRGGGGGGGSSFFVRERNTLVEFDSDLYQALFKYKSLSPIAAQVKPGKPPALPSGIVYQYYDVTTSKVDLLSATLYFRVPSDWLDGHDLDAANVALQRYDGGWAALVTQQLLPSTPLGQAAAVVCTGLLCTFGKAIFQLLSPPSYSYYSSVAAGTGLFAVTAVTSAPPSVEQGPPITVEQPLPQAPPPQEPATTETSQPPPPEEEGFRQLFILSGLLGGLVLLLLVAFLVKHFSAVRPAGLLADVPGDKLLTLTEWITKCRAAGFPDAQIRQKLRGAGWIDEVLDAYLRR